MQSIVLFLGLLVFAAPVLSGFYPPYDPATSKTFCYHERSVETFTATFFTAMLVKYGFEEVAATETSGKAAAKTEHKLAVQVQEAQGLSDVEETASTDSRPLAKLKKVHLAEYLEKRGHSLGVYLYQSRILNCANALDMGFDYFSLVVKNMDDCDDQLFASYQQSAIQGLVDFEEEHQLDKADAARKLAYLFAEEFRKDACPVV